MILTRSRLPTFGLALLFLAATATGDAPSVNCFLNNGVTAHRGNSAEYPENTIPAFRSGIEIGADWIELDIFCTQDGKLVVLHDRTTERVGDKNLVVPDSTYEQLLSVDVATEFRKRHGRSIEAVPRHTIPLLKDVILLVMTQTKTRVSIQPKMDCVAEAIALVCYTDTTIALPILTHYALANHKPRKLKRLYDQRPVTMEALVREYFAHNK